MEPLSITRIFICDWLKIGLKDFKVFWAASILLKVGIAMVRVDCMLVMASHIDVYLVDLKLEMYSLAGTIRSEDSGKALINRFSRLNVFNL